MVLFSALPTDLGNRGSRFPHSHRHDDDEDELNILKTRPAKRYAFWGQGHRDGGSHWGDPKDPPDRYPSPRYYAVIIVSLLLTLPAFTPVTLERPRDSAANRQISDSPIGPGDLD